jgi:hypothetical protein
VCAGAGVLFVLAGGAVGKVEVEFLSHGLGIRRGFDLNDGGQVGTFGDGLVGDELVAILSEGQLRWSRTISHNDADDLSAWGDDLHVVVNESDFDFVVFVHEELDVRFDFGNELATGGTGFSCMFVIMLFFVRSGGGEGKREGEQGGDEAIFHGLVFRGLFWGLGLL